MTTTQFLIIMFSFGVVMIAWFFFLGIKGTSEAIDYNNKEYLKAIDKIRPSTKRTKNNPINCEGANFTKPLAHIT